MSKAVKPLSQPLTLKDEIQNKEFYAFGCVQLDDKQWISTRVHIKNGKMINAKEVFRRDISRSVHQDQLEIAIERAWSEWI